jgi:hypothetical protein
MSKESFLMYLSFWEPVKDLPREQKGELLEAIYGYQISGEIMQLSPPVKMAFAFLKSQFQRDDAKYLVIVEKRRESGRKGAEVTNSGKCRQMSASASKQRQSSAKSAVSVSDTVSGSDNELILSGDVSPDSVFSFEQFWKAYGKPIDRTKCETKFKKIKTADIELIKEKLPGYITATPDAQFRKNPLTWLNGSCWLDEAVTEPAKPAFKEFGGIHESY